LVDLLDITIRSTRSTRNVLVQKDMAQVPTQIK